MKGSVEVSGHAYAVGQMVVFKKEAEPLIYALEDVVMMFLGGEPLGERFIWWNFLSSRKEGIEQAKADWKAERIKLPPDDNNEFIPLPENKSRPAGSPHLPLSHNKVWCFYHLLAQTREARSAARERGLV